MLPILFKIGDFEVHTFGLVLIVAFIAAYFFGKARAPRFGLTREQVADAFFWTLVLGVIGARLGFIVQELPHYLKHPDQLLSLKFQGLTSYGGLILGFLGLAWMAKRAGRPVRTYLDLAGAPLLLGHAIGRIGCLLNGCCYGRRCELPWGIHVEGQDGIFHPAQVYDSLMVLGGLVLLLWIERRGLKPGQSAALAVALYSLSRFIYEFWRAGSVAEVNAGFATSTYFDGLAPFTDGHLFALATILVCAIAFWRLGKQKAPEPSPEAA